jgi:tRNA (cmo5U34)-methyltransferase
VASVGDGIRADPGAWSFDNEVADNFDVHITRSVPFYRQTHQLIEQLSDRFVAYGSRVYDLGCSTGALSVRLAQRHRERDIGLVAVDREPRMVEQTRERCAAHPSVTVLEEDLVAFDVLPAALVIAHYTVQFVPPDARPSLIERIARALDDRGAFLLFEKVRPSDPRLDALTTELYYDWKRSQGYSDAEIVAKARSLEGVLVPFTPKENRDLLRAAGFDKVITVFRWLNWEGLLALRE